MDSLAVLDHRIDSPSQPTLREALSASATPLPALRSLLAHVTASLLRPASPAPPPTTADRCRINEVDSLLSSLLDELEQKYAPDSRRDDEPSPAKKTMLHRSIPGFDFFTAPGELTPDQLRKLSQGQFFPLFSHHDTNSMRTIQLLIRTSSRWYHRRNRTKRYRQQRPNYQKSTQPRYPPSSIPSRSTHRKRLPSPVRSSLGVPC